MEEETLKIRLSATRTAQERSRIALLVTTIISLALLAAVWNAYVSFSFRAIKELSADWNNSKEGTPRQILWHTVIEEWVKNRTINIAPLGVRVGIDDGPLVGGLALTMALFWFYACVRAEYHVIVGLLDDTTIIDPKNMERIFHGVNAYSVFTVLRLSTASRGMFAARAISLAVWFFPGAVATLVMLLDLLSAFWISSPFREGPDPPFWQWAASLELGEAVLWLIGTVTTVIVWLLCFASRRLDRAIERRLEEYSRDLDLTQMP